MKCWGSNGFGQLGNGTFSNSSVPVNVLGLTSGVVAISSGRSHSCAITTTSALKCWGDNGEGELGNGSTTSSNTPVDVVDMASGVASVSAGGEHTCAVTASGGAKCWGYNAFGSLGTGSCCGRRPTPVDVVGLTSGVAAVSSTSYFHACALTTAGGVECWGLNANGELGDGTTTTRYFPAPVSGLASGITAVSAGNVHTCALRTTGGVNCWGDNTHGQVGDGGLCGSACTTPTDVQGLTSGVAAVSAGLSHTCAVTSSGFVLCWGVDDYGQLGDGTTGTDATIPVKAEGLGPKAVGGVSELTGAVRTTSSGEGGGWLLAEAAAAVVIGVALSGGVWLAYRRSR